MISSEQLERVHSQYEFKFNTQDLSLYWNSFR